MSKRRSPEEKASIVVEFFTTSIPAAELCRKHSVSPATFQDWKDKFLQGGRQALADWGGAAKNHAKEVENLKRIIEVMRNPPIFGGTAATAASFCSFKGKRISADTARIHAVSFWADWVLACAALQRGNAPGNYYLTGARELAWSQSTDVRHCPGGASLRT